MPRRDPEDVEKRCEHVDKDGERCTGYLTQYDPQFCIFHSHLPVVRELLQAGRQKGGSKPSKVRISFKRVKNVKDVLFHLNDLLPQAQGIDQRLSVLGAITKVLELKDIVKEVEKLKDAIEQLSGDGIPLDSDEVEIKVTYDADGNGLEKHEQED